MNNTEKFDAELESRNAVPTVFISHSRISDKPDSKRLGPFVNARDHVPLGVLLCYVQESMHPLERETIQAHLSRCLICSRQVDALRAAKFATDSRSARLKSEDPGLQENAPESGTLSERLHGAIQAAVKDWSRRNGLGRAGGPLSANLTMCASHQSTTELWDFEAEGFDFTADLDGEEVEFRIMTQILDFRDRELSLAWGGLEKRAAFLFSSPSTLCAKFRFARNEVPATPQDLRAN